MTAQDRSYRRWTDKEVALLKSHYGRIDTADLCRLLHVSHSRLRRKVKALGLGYQREYDEYVSMRQVRGILGVQHYQIQRFIRNGLPVVRRSFGNHYNIMTRMSDLVDWLERNQNMWQAVRVEHMALGGEPAWLRDKRCAEYALRNEAV